MVDEKNKTKETKEVQSELPALEIVEAKGINTAPYIGRKSTIELVEIKSGKHSQYVKLSTEVLGQEDGKDIRASMIFSLKQTSEGLGIPEKGDLKKYMDNKKVEDYRDLKGMDVVILSKADENKIDWLIFN